VRTTRYRVKEVFYTLQGEGGHAGRPAVFCRFAGCNLWTGYERDRGRGPSCSRWCDTDFVGTDGPGGNRFATPSGLAAAVAAVWGSAGGRRFVVCTGGEPTVQLDDAAVAALHDHEFEVAIETNGTRPVPLGVDWVCVSPKAGTDLVTTTGDELKLVYPQSGAEPDRYIHLAGGFRRLLLQPMDGPDRDGNTRAAIAYCLADPRWSLSIQIHKYVGMR
jgi:7-carboxy-7-deazaguanine synthase